ncbi:unnamed protein product [Gordionus sp. m RMFG-2023]|uniref:eukaryotic translation initiation factor 3 subunit F-1-like n=1 Tax=Gordionus sp. m RMFG-2023 TaxID=3053472 RepID=UPI0030E30449
MSTLIKCKVHSVVLFSIINAYERRNEEDQDLIGILLGSPDKDVVEITNCFPITLIKKKDEIFMDSELASSMYEINKKGNANEIIVGWFTTDSNINSATFEIHAQYSKLSNNPILLTLDTSLKNNRMDCKAYINQNMGVPEKLFGSMFMPIDITIVNYPCEKIAIDTLVKDEKRLLNTLITNQVSPAVNLGLSNSDSPSLSNYNAVNFNNPTRLPTKTVFPVNPSDLSKLSMALEEMIEKLKLLKKYTESHNNNASNNLNINYNGKVDTSSFGGSVDLVDLGRTLKELIGCVPIMEKGQFEELFKGNMKDMMMILYVLKLLQCQVNVQAKLNML